VAEILDLQDRRRRLCAGKGYANWSRRFAESFDEKTTIADLSDPTLGVLIRGDEEASLCLHDFVMGVMGLGQGLRFHFLDNTMKMSVMDLTFFLLDQLRFEAMKRLGWLEDHPCLHVPMVDLVSFFRDTSPREIYDTPALARSHPGFEEYEKTLGGDRGAYVRRLIPDAIKEFLKRYAPDA